MMARSPNFPARAAAIAMHRFSILFLLGCAACGATTSAPPAVPAAHAQDTLRQIRAMVGAAPCGASTQCHTLALGAKACGGPEAYLAWSSAATREGALLALAARYRAQREAENVASPLLSDCRLVEDPGALCRVAVGAAQRACALRGPAERFAD
ncbi:MULTISPECIES: hypothetical protein [unclassified Janthinobacterium]|uniref:hypothetical protein n=1 Tax=unclassified Janthinobacterium TaxID=2610881 RepID=UPI000346964C|nr:MULTISPECIES: hypothetical protein [unclassified Janthinobacterium]MEC5163372.1 hypothetical protein [Janthinobacterium sp. CG_S6]